MERKKKREEEMNGLGCVSVFLVCFVCVLVKDSERGEYKEDRKEEEERERKEGTWRGMERREESCMIMYDVMDGWFLSLKNQVTQQVNPITA